MPCASFLIPRGTKKGPNSTHSPEQWTTLVATETPPSCVNASCQTERPLEVKGSRKASQTAFMSEYRLLYKGLTPSLPAGFNTDCILHMAAANSLNDSLVFIAPPRASFFLSLFYQVQYHRLF